MFGLSTNEPLPPAYLTSYDAWDGYMADVWRPMLAQYSAGQASSIVEVAPGNSCKIGLALAPLEFAGTLYLVEPSARLGESAAQRCRHALPKATIQPLACTLAESLDVLPTRALLVSNHPLDDMLLTAHMPAESRAELFAWSATGSDAPPDRLQQRWQQLAAQPGALDAAIEAVLQEWQAAITRLEPRAILLAQYGSAVLQRSGMEALNIAAKQVLARLRDWAQPLYASDADIQQQLDENKHYHDRYIGTEVLNAAHWWVAGRR